MPPGVSGGRSLGWDGRPDRPRKGRAAGWWQDRARGEPKGSLQCKNPCRSLS
ncbi:hypothetical protein D9X30_5161 [Cupriavidus sp. U2]|nr:hypothetical protein D9X30_5161 [Cupriavidus sp. U2]